LYEHVERNFVLQNAAKISYDTLKDFKQYNKLIEIVKESLLTKEMELDYIVLALEQTEANRIAG
jgi:hypothetical protein